MFSVERENDDLCVRLVVQGELDMDTGPRLQAEVDRAHAAAPQRLVLDPCGVTFFDSTGLQIVLDAELRCREERRELLVVAGDGEARRVLEPADVADQLRIER